ncbi:MAG TPA: YggS family pyridoxal phosphate-dependent enzyme [Firmicutes bacterium]|nr:YggS family pyridoxal phosphate-dependent enzyme [Bacillota bacterium]
MLEQNINEINNRLARAALKRGISPVEITLVAVSKTVSAEQIKQASALGIRHFGENRVQEALPKIAAVPEPCWHFIGHLQTNKVKQVLDHFTLIQSLDRFKLATALQQEGERRGCLINVLLQVNIGAEESKYGFAVEEIGDALMAIAGFKHIRVQGLMAIAPFLYNPEELRPYFRHLYGIFKNLNIPGVEMKTLSMGMTNDFEVAVEEGSNMVRIGTALFGVRA